MKAWQVQEAKMKLSQLINEAKKQPQLITVRGEETVVIISKKSYEKLIKPKLSIYEAMQKFPYKEKGFKIERVRHTKLRKIKL